MKKYITLLFAFLYGAVANAAVDSWNVYLSFPSVDAITQSDNKIYALGSNAMFSLNKSDNFIETFSVLNGLSDSDIKHIKFDENNNSLVIVYANSNIDLLTTKGIYNLSEFKSKDMTGSKRINKIVPYENNIYLAADYGILKINQKKKEFADTYHPLHESNVIDVAFLGNKIYAISTDSLLSADATDIFLVNPERWTNIDNLPGETYHKNKQIVSFDNHLFLLKSDSTLYVTNDFGNSWTTFAKSVVSVNTSQNRLNVVQNNSAKSYSSLNSEPKTISVNFAITDAVFNSSENSFFVTAGSQGLGKVLASDQSYSFFKVDGPGSDKSYTMKFADGRLYVITIGTWIDGSNSTDWVQGMVMIYDGKTWKNIPVPNCTDFMDIAIDPNDKTHFFIGTYASGGVLEFRNDQFYKRYNAQNTNNIIEDVFGNDLYIVYDALNFDSNGDLWMMQMLGAFPVKVLRSNGTWEQYKNFTKINGTGKVMRGNVIDGNGAKWVFSPQSNFIFVYDTSNGNNAYRTSFTDQDGKTFTSERFRCAAVDHKNSQEVWLGSNYGPIIVPNAKNFYSSDLIRRIKIPRNDGSGLADYLLGNEPINYIAVDGANRKWLATRTSGVYLVSPDGTETIKHFTTENSPLLGDNVYTIAINHSTGEVFFCTDKGICSYMSDASSGLEEFDNVYAYPNPVRENYEGVISINNLVEDSNVKITDISGNLIYETTSNGGMATWDCTDRTGNRVSTGVYLILCYSETTKKSAVCKVLIINK